MLERTSPCSDLANSTRLLAFGNERALFSDEAARTKAWGAEALGNESSLNITVVVLTGPEETTSGLHHESDHIRHEHVLVE